MEFSYPLDTTKLAEGQNHLGLAIVGKDGSRLKEQIGYVIVDNEVVVEPPPTTGEGYRNPWLFDTQNAGIIPGWEGIWVTSGSKVTKMQNSPFWPSSVWARKQEFHDLGTTERERCMVNFNSMGRGMDVGSNSAPGVTLWQYEEFVFPAASFPTRFANGSWNTFAINWHHGHGSGGSVGQVPFHISASNARIGGNGQYELIAQVRGGCQISAPEGCTLVGNGTEPNTEDFLLASPLRYDHVYRVMVRQTLAPNGTCPNRNRFLGTSQAGQHIVPLTTGDSHGIVEIWVDDVLKVSKRRPTSYYNLVMYTRSDCGRNPAETGDFVFWATKRAQARTRPELFATIKPTTQDTFAQGG